MSENFKVGEIVEHVLNKEWLLILEVDEETSSYVCRTKNLTIDAFYDFELTKRKPVQ